jgi:FtsP/CotA-like multicopper oxidase with cupredoxin domain
VKPHEIAEVLVVADNPGAWALHCHNAYHMETGMVTSMLYNT